MCPQLDSNQRPLPPEGSALSAELYGLTGDGVVTGDSIPILRSAKRERPWGVEASRTPTRMPMAHRGGASTYRLLPCEGGVPAEGVDPPGATALQAALGSGPCWLDQVLRTATVVKIERIVATARRTAKTRDHGVQFLFEELDLVSSAARMASAVARTDLAEASA